MKMTLIYSNLAIHKRRCAPPQYDDFGSQQGAYKLRYTLIISIIGNMETYNTQRYQERGKLPKKFFLFKAFNSLQPRPGT